MAAEAPTHPAMALVNKMYECSPRAIWRRSRPTCSPLTSPGTCPVTTPVRDQEGPDEVMLLRAPYADRHRRRQHHLRDDGR
jgi:hypothetical protein